MAKRLQGIDLCLELPRCEDVLAAWVPQREDPVIPLVKRRAPPRVRTMAGTGGPSAARAAVEDPVEPSGWSLD